METEVEAQIGGTGARRRRLVLLLAWLLAFLLLAAFGLWLLRIRLATDYIDREFERRGVEATYEVKRIGFGTQIFENLVIGDPRRPDLTAREVRIQIFLGLGMPRIGLITARGVRLRGRLIEGKLDLGQVDRLMPPAPGGLPFRLPDQRVDLADAAVFLETPAGPLAIGVAGHGQLSDGFRGGMALAAGTLRLGDCRLSTVRVRAGVVVRQLRPTFNGPAALDRLTCGDDLHFERPVVDARVTLTPALDGWTGSGRGRADRFATGPHRLAAPRADFTASGNAQRTEGRVTLGAGAALLAGFTLEGLGARGNYALSFATGAFDLSGEAQAAGLRAPPAMLGAAGGALRSASSTPVGPIADALRTALRRAGEMGTAAEAGFSLVSREDGGALRIDRLALRSRSEARLDMTGGRGIVWSWPVGLVQVDGAFALSGGGFPNAGFVLSQAAPGAPIDGRGNIQPMNAGGARLQLGDIRFGPAPGGRTRVTGTALVSGPIDGGRIERLRLPLDLSFGDGGFAFGTDCLAAQFARLDYGSLRLGPTRMPLCPVGPAMLWQPRGGGVRGVIEWRDPRFAGAIGGTRLRLAADRLRFDVARTSFTAAGIESRLGPDGSATRIDAARLDGRFDSAGIAGAFSGLGGQIANVPLIVSRGEGRWRLRGSRLEMNGGLQVADAQQTPPRFHPVISRDFTLTLADNVIRAGGWLLHPDTGTRVTEATIVHNLASGAGNAVLDVPGIRFAEDFQPEMLTPLTLGVVALVDGSVSGRGEIDWDSRGVRSTGTFGTRGMNLAAPFGPVEGFTTTVQFADLLALRSAPGQMAEIDLIRAGLDVPNGRVRYQLLPGNLVQIESGVWDYSGGELHLEPTLLDFNVPEKRLTFRAEGIDAATFVQRMEFGNIAATGTFDGVIPMIVDQSGARVVGGHLEARPPGGTLSYVGELTDRELGIYGKLAFDALKELTYSRFTMDLDGALDGEFFSEIRIDGVARNPELASPVGAGVTGILARRVIGQLGSLPFRFNIRVRGPFRAVLATARSFDDPTPLIQPVLPRMLRDLPTDVTVQDEESEPVQ